MVLSDGELCVGANNHSPPVFLPNSSVAYRKANCS